MHTFFRVLSESLAGARIPEGAQTERILFRLISIEEEQWLVELTPNGCRVLEPRGEHADLTIFCDRAQLDAMLTEGFTTRPLRFAGKKEALDHLAALAKPSGSWLDAQRSRE